MGYDLSLKHEGASSLRKICIVSGTRADFGIYIPIINKIIAEPNLELSLFATGMHLSDEFGKTIDMIKELGYKVDAEIESLENEDTGAAMARLIGNAIIGFTKGFTEKKPDIVLLLGDRGEMLAAAIAASHMNIPTAHLHGGEESGTIDDLNRNAITKISSIHLPATKKSRDRIIAMGEKAETIHVVGAPGLDPIYNKEYASKEKVVTELGIDPDKELILVVQHSNTFEVEESANQIKETLEAISELKKQTILIYPNSDAGGRAMIEVIKDYESLPFLKVYKNLPRDLYLGVMACSDVLIGNSSSGIIEAPAMKVGVVNIGSRQQNREKAECVLDVPYDKSDILQALKLSLSKKHKEKIRLCEHPYGSGNSSEKIVEILSSIAINRKMIEKK